MFVVWAGKFSMRLAICHIPSYFIQPLKPGSFTFSYSTANDHSDVMCMLGQKSVDTDKTVFFLLDDKTACLKKWKSVQQCHTNISPSCLFHLATVHSWLRCVLREPYTVGLSSRLETPEPHHLVFPSQIMRSGSGTDGGDLAAGIHGAEFRNRLWLLGNQFWLFGI